MLLGSFPLLPLHHLRCPRSHPPLALQGSLAVQHAAARLLHAARAQRRGSLPPPALPAAAAAAAAAATADETQFRLRISAPAPAMRSLLQTLLAGSALSAASEITRDHPRSPEMTRDYISAVSRLYLGCISAMSRPGEPRSLRLDRRHARALEEHHTHLTHAHWALHFECRGAPVVRRGDARVAWPLPHHPVCVEKCT